MVLQMTSFCHLSYKRHGQEWWWQYCRASGDNSKDRLWNPCDIALLINSWLSGRQAAKQNGLRRSFLYWCSKMISNSWKPQTAQLVFKIGMKLKMITELKHKAWKKKKSQEIIYIEIPEIFICIFIVCVQTSLKTGFRDKDVENYFLVCSCLEVFLLYL